MKSISRISTLLLLFLLLLFSDLSLAQQSNENRSAINSFTDRLFFGGALGFSVGTYSSLIEVSPILGYALTDDFVVGIGFTYKYYRYKDYFAQVDQNGKLLGLYDFKSNMYGGSVWSRYFLTKTEIPVIENIFLHAEVEPLMFVNKYKLDPDGDYFDIYNNRYVNEDEKITLTGFFMGGGLRQMIGRRSYMYLELLWNFNEEFYSPYSNPRIRIGVAAGF